MARTRGGVPARAALRRSSTNPTHTAKPVTARKRAAIPARPSEASALASTVWASEAAVPIPTV
ncbi:MAG: hypothetical protein ACRDIW_02085 [Actinomycetota bacterium]